MSLIAGRGCRWPPRRDSVSPCAPLSGGGRDTHDGHENSPILVFFSNLLGLQHTVGSPLVPDLSTRPAWRMRQINREARRHTRIASAVQENRLLLDGTDYEQIYLTTMARGERAQRVWNTSRLETFDYFIVHPQHVADNDALSARLSACDTQPLSQSVHGPDDVIGISPCANDL